MDWDLLLKLLAPPIEASVEGALLMGVLLALGLTVGVLTGFFGVGGGFLVVPLLNVALGIPYELAVGSSLSFMIGTSFSGVLRQRREGNVHFQVSAYLVSGSLIGAIVGDWLQNLLLFQVAGGREEVFTPIMHSIFILLLVGTILGMKPGRAKGASAAAGTAGEAAKPTGAAGGNGNTQEKLPLLLRFGPGPRFQTPESEAMAGSRGYSVPGTFVVGAGVGITTGLLGIGGGVLLVPVLLGLFGLSHQRAAGTSLAVIFATAIAGIVKKGLAEIPKVSLPLTVMLLLGSVIGVQLGVFLVKKTGAHDFKRYFVYVLLLAIALIAADLAGIF